ncbi:MAG: hypothetical protein QGG54_10540 [Gammaproteobacteria bacterium]|jgi:hypothetical protein|nr:hypothetical protein [Gammaproteobacteria bacterium]
MGAHDRDKKWVAEIQEKEYRFLLTVKLSVYWAATEKLNEPA